MIKLNSAPFKSSQTCLELLVSYFEVLHVSGQIDIMCQGLREISTTQKSHPSAMKSLIEMHQRIISLSKNIDNFFSFVALIQFVWNTLVICSIGIMIMIVSKNVLSAMRKCNALKKKLSRNYAICQSLLNIILVFYSFILLFKILKETKNL